MIEADVWNSKHPDQLEERRTKNEVYRSVERVI